jgi:hypothetical protein
MRSRLSWSSSTTASSGPTARSPCRTSRGSTEPARTTRIYFGASLAALDRLGRQKGYRLVGSNSAGNNAFFVREELAAGLPAPAVADAYVGSRYRESRDEAGNLTYLAGPDRRRAIADLQVWDLEHEQLVRLGEL